MHKKYLIALAIIFDWLGLSTLKAFGLVSAPWLQIIVLPLATAAAAYLALAVLAAVVIFVFAICAFAAGTVSIKKGN